MAKLRPGQVWRNSWGLHVTIEKIVGRSIHYRTEQRPDLSFTLSGNAFKSTYNYLGETNIIDSEEEVQALKKENRILEAEVARLRNLILQARRILLDE